MIYKFQAVKGEIQVYDKFETQAELQIMRDGFTQEFLDQFDKGIKLYLEGNWEQARDELEQVELVKGKVDFPT